MRLDAGGDDLLARVRHVHHADLAAVEQAIDVLAEPEDGALAVGPLVGADALEGADAVVQRVRQDVDVGLA